MWDSDLVRCIVNGFKSVCQGDGLKYALKLLLNQIMSLCQPLMFRA